MIFPVFTHMFLGDLNDNHFRRVCRSGVRLHRHCEGCWHCLIPHSISSANKYTMKLKPVIGFCNSTYHLPIKIVQINSESLSSAIAIHLCRKNLNPLFWYLSSAFLQWVKTMSIGKIEVMSITHIQIWCENHYIVQDFYNRTQYKNAMNNAEHVSYSELKKGIFYLAQWVSYWVPIASIWEKGDCIIMWLYFTWYIQINMRCTWNQISQDACRPGSHTNRWNLDRILDSTKICLFMFSITSVWSQRNFAHTKTAVCAKFPCGQISLL